MCCRGASLGAARRRIGCAQKALVLGFEKKPSTSIGSSLSGYTRERVPLDSEVCLKICGLETALHLPQEACRVGAIDDAVII